MSEEKKNRNKILLVEDNPDILESLEILLTHWNYQVSTVSKGDQVKGEVARFKPDLILLDVMIPKPDGISLCMELKSDSKTRNIPIVILSAKAQKAEIDQGLGIGADRYLTKPYKNDDVLKVVTELLSAS